jgi:hypothetical protein
MVKSVAPTLAFVSAVSGIFTRSIWSLPVPKNRSDPTVGVVGLLVGVEAGVVSGADVSGVDVAGGALVGATLESAETCEDGSVLSETPALMQATPTAATTPDSIRLPARPRRR